VLLISSLNGRLRPDVVYACQDLLAVDLGKLAIAGLLHRNPELNPKDVDCVLFGTVIQECRTSNIAREVKMMTRLQLVQRRCRRGATDRAQNLCV
jgi:acetyl-CoA acetyltransferase